MHDPRLDRVHVGREVVQEVVFGQPGEALLVDVQVRQCRARGALRQQFADRFALVQAEARDVDQADDVRRIPTQRGDDLTAVGVAATRVAPSCRASTWRRRATSAASEASANWGALTL
jgi:hypothetical protein